MNIKNYKSGFTLLELVTVQVCIMILAMIAWSNYHQYVFRAKMAESFVVLGNMERQLRTYYYENGSFITTPPNPASAPGIDRPGAQNSFGNSDSWQTLGMPVVAGENVFFSYQAFAGETGQNSPDPIENEFLHSPHDDMDLIRSGLYSSSVTPAAMPSYALHSKDFGFDFGQWDAVAQTGWDQQACMRSCGEDQRCIDLCKPPTEGSDDKDTDGGYGLDPKDPNTKDTCIALCRGDRVCESKCTEGGDDKNPPHGQPGHRCDDRCDKNPPHGQPGHNCHSSCSGNPPHGHDGHICNGHDDSCEDRCRGNQECISKCGNDDGGGGGGGGEEPTCEEACKGDQTCLRDSCGIGVGIDPPEPTCEEQWYAPCDGLESCISQHCDDDTGNGGGGNPSINACDPFTISKPVDFGVRTDLARHKWVIITSVGSLDPADTKCSLKAKVIQSIDGSDPFATGFITFDEREVNSNPFGRLLR